MGIQILQFLGDGITQLKLWIKFLWSFKGLSILTAIAVGYDWPLFVQGILLLLHRYCEHRRVYLWVNYQKKDCCRLCSAGLRLTTAWRRQIKPAQNFMASTRAVCQRTFTCSPILSVLEALHMQVRKGSSATQSTMNGFHTWSTLAASAAGVSKV